MWKLWTRPTFWHHVEDDQSSISQILTGFSGFKWRRIHCDGCSFFILLNEKLKQIFPSKVRIFSCSSDGQKSYCWRTFCQQIYFISQQFAWKVGRGNGQFSHQMPNMETCFIPMLQSSRCIYQTILYRTQIDVQSRDYCLDYNWGHEIGLYM